MSGPLREIRALLLQFKRSNLRDLTFYGRDWTVFMARPDGVANPLLSCPVGVTSTGAVLAISAPHLGLFEPACAQGDSVDVGMIVGRIDVLGRKTELVSNSAGRISAVRCAANDLVEYGDVVIEIDRVA